MHVFCGVKYKKSDTMNKYIVIGLVLVQFFTNCHNEHPKKVYQKNISCQDLLSDYKAVNLLVDTSVLKASEKELIPVFKEISGIIDELFWYQSYGQSTDWKGVGDSCLQQMLKINFGPWNRFRNNKPIIDSIGPKPFGSNFYPADMDKKEFLAWDDSLKTSPYTYIRRNCRGELKTVPYSVENRECLKKLSILLQKAADITEDELFKNYLLLRANSFLSDQYTSSDLAWLKTKDNLLDFIAGPIEIYDDKLFGYKTEFESFLFIKDTVLTKNYTRYAMMLPFLQKALPVKEIYRHEDPEMISDLSVCNIICYGGGARAGGYNISVTYPSAFQEMGHKRQKIVQFKNVLDIKYQHIFYPIAQKIIAADQQKYIDMESFFQNNLFFELGLRLGIKNVIGTNETVRDVLKENATILHLTKAYAMSLYIAEKLASVNEIDHLQNNYTVFLAEIFRIARFESSSAYAKSKMLIFNYLKKNNAVVRNSQGQYSIDFNKIKPAIDGLINQILVIQGNGSYDDAYLFIDEYLFIDKTFKDDLDKLTEYKLHIDILLKQ